MQSHHSSWNDGASSFCPSPSCHFLLSLCSPSVAVANTYPDERHANETDKGEFDFRPPGTEAVIHDLHRSRPDGTKATTHEVVLIR